MLVDTSTTGASQRACHFKDGEGPLDRSSGSGGTILLHQTSGAYNCHSVARLNERRRGRVQFRSSRYEDARSTTMECRHADVAHRTRRGGRDAGSSDAVSFSVVVVVLVLVLLLVLVLVLVLVLLKPSWGASCGRRKIMFPEGLPGT